MTLTPREAITRRQVWLRPFGHFTPADQGYMGFSSAGVRDSFYNRIEDGALVVLWTREKEGERGWVGKFRGILQMTKDKGLASAYSTPVGMAASTGSRSDFTYAVRGIRAWEADPHGKVLFKDVVPSIWPGQTQTIGQHSGLMAGAELPNLESLRVREVAIYPASGPATSAFEEVRSLFK